jgi:PASTA domain
MRLATWLTREYQVSIGPSWNQPCLVPTLPDSYPPSVGAVEAQIRAQGCAVGKVTDAPSDTVPDGYVISLRPAASPKFLRQGTKISITESSGPPVDQSSAIR